MVRARSVPTRIRVFTARSDGSSPRSSSAANTRSGAFGVLGSTVRSTLGCHCQSSVGGHGRYTSHGHVHTGDPGSRCRTTAWPLSGAGVPPARRTWPARISVATMNATAGHALDQRADRAVVDAVREVGQDGGGDAEDQPGAGKPWRRPLCACLGQQHERRRDDESVNRTAAARAVAIGWPCAECHALDVGEARRWRRSRRPRARQRRSARGRACPRS